MSDSNPDETAAPVPVGEPEEPAWLRSGVASALLRAIDADANQALLAATKLLERALPARTRRITRGVVFGKFVGVKVDLGTERFELEIDGSGSLIGYETHVSAGIALKRAAVPLGAWTEALTARLEAIAQTDAAARRALGEWRGEVGG